jgi:hypothetical protein
VPRRGAHGVDVAVVVEELVPDPPVAPLEVPEVAPLLVV